MSLGERRTEREGDSQREREKKKQFTEKYIGLFTNI